MNIKVDALQVTLGQSEILKDVSINAEGGKFIGVIGPNGSGKSTLLKCIYRVLEPTHGCIYLNNASIHKLSYKESAKRVGVVTQHNFYNFDFTVSEVVLMGRTPHKKHMERDNANDYRLMNDALARVEMLEFKHRIFSTLSGGEQQRVILARALVQETDCLILDEPTNHLDIKHQLKIMDLSKRLGITVIAALHDLNVAASYCDYMYILKSGEIVGEGAPKEVLRASVIGAVYGVRAKILTDPETSAFHIAYLPNY